LRLSEDKISHLAHLLTENPRKEKLIQFEDVGRVLRMTKQILTNYCKMDDEIDEMVRKKLQSYSRNILEGSQEWDILYRKHFEEEMKKRWR